AVRSDFESHLLALMRGTQALTAAARISDTCAALGAGTSHPQVRTFWNLAAAMFEAQHHGLLAFDVFTKRVASRLLAQLRLLERGDSDVSERLARDALFFCSQAALAGRGTHVPRLDAVREAYGFAYEEPTDYSHSVLGRFDPAIITHAKKRVAAAKEAWQAIAGGELHRLSGLSEQFALVGDSLRRLFPFGEAFATELQGAVQQTQGAQAAPPAPLAMEVATSLLYLEAALEDGDFDQPEHAERIKRLGERLARVRQKSPPDPLEPWMEELYRRVSDRQTMGSVVQELRASLLEIEKAIDKFFRNPTDASVLNDVPQQLGSMRGVLSVLGVDAAAQALVRMRSEIDGLATTQIDPAKIGSSGVFERIAGNLSALGFMIDMLSVQPQMAKSLFVYDSAAGTLAPVMGRSVAPKPPPIEIRLLEQAQMLAFTSVREDVPVEEVKRDLERLSQEAHAADQPALAAAVQKAQEALDTAQDEGDIASARGELSEALVDFVATSTEPVALAPVSTPVPLEPIKPIALVEDFEHDDEMREVFLEEAREVVQSGRAASAQLRGAPEDLALMTTLRRAFHTLKGSSRMVGLKAFGEAAWSCEQVFNTQLAEQRAAEAPLLDFSDWVLAYLGDWVEDIAAHRSGLHNERDVRLAAGKLAGTGVAAEPAADIALPIGLPAALPTSSDLELLPVGEASSLAPLEPAAFEDTAPAEEPSAIKVEDADGLAFELDLSKFDGGRGEAGAGSPPAAPTLADPAASPMFDRFDEAQPTGKPARSISGHAEFAGSSDFVDLDLTSPSDGRELIQPLAPSDDAARAHDAMAGLSLDLSTGEVERTPPRIAPVDLELDGAPPAAEQGSDENVKVVGPLRIGIPLFNIYLNEADELSRRLVTEVAEWAMELHRPVGEVPIALAHSLAGSSATVGFTDLSHLARSLEHALARTQVIGHGTDEEARLFVNASEEIRRLLHQFAAGFLQQPAPDLVVRLAEHEVSSALRLEAATAASELAEAQDSVSPGEPPLAVESLLKLEGIDDVADAANDAHAEASPVAHGPATDVEVRELAPTELPTSGDTSLIASSTAEAPVAAAASAHDATSSPLPAPEAHDAPEAHEALEAHAAPAAHPAPDAHGHAEATPSTFGALGSFQPLGVAELKPLGAAPVETGRAAPARPSTFGDVDDDIDAIDAVDLELFPIFEEEAQELLPKLDSQLRDWLGGPAESSHAAACMRTLHTLKGGARLAGAMRLGEMAHRLETRIERLVAHDGQAAVGDIEALQSVCDAMTQAFEALRSRDAQAYADAVAAATSAPVAVPHRETRPAPLPDAPVFVATPEIPAIEPTKAANDEPAPIAAPRREHQVEPKAQPAPAGEPAR
ncbi:MAG: Hpt domain-containing protein, partial [Rhizobacter sp.]|nr:Hpt domain-containing protein [Rhizobacter sp.]